MAWVKVQSGASPSFGSGTTLSFTYGSNNTVGNLLVAHITWDASTAPTSVTDTRGNTWVLSGTVFDSSDSASTSVYYVASCGGGSNTVTFTWAASHGFMAAVWSEWSGQATSGLADGNTGQQVMGTTTTDGETSTAITTTQNGDLIYGAYMASGGGNYSAVGTGFTIVANMSTDLAGEYQVQNTAGSIAATWTSTSTARYTALIAAFAPTAAGGGTPDANQARPQILPLPFITPWQATSKPLQLLGDTSTPSSIALTDTGTGVDAISVVVFTTDPNQALPAALPLPFVSPWQGPTSTPAQLLGDASTPSSITLTDTGTGTDSITVTAAVPLADTGSGTDAITVAIAVTLTDTGTGLDDVTVAAAITLTDTGTGVDALTATSTDPYQALPQALWQLIAPGLGPASTPLQLLGDASTPSSITLADVGTGTDAVTVAAAVPLADAGTGVDALTVAVAVTLTDIGSGFDDVTVAAAVTLTDTGTGVDQLSVTGGTDPNQAALSTLPLPFVSPWQGPTGTPNQLLGSTFISGDRSITLADVGTGADALTVAAALALADLGTGADALSIAAAITLAADTATAVDALSILVAGPYQVVLHANLTVRANGAELTVRVNGGGLTVRANGAELTV